VGESPRADVMRLPRHLLRTADRGLGTQALNCIVGKDGAVITPRYRRRKVVDRAFAHSESIPYCGEQQKNRRRVRRSATAYRRQRLQNGPQHPANRSRNAGPDFIRGDCQAKRILECANGFGRRRYGYTDGAKTDASRFSDAARNEPSPVAT
jgi:hypothetical protein